MFCPSTSRAWVSLTEAGDPADSALTVTRTHHGMDSEGCGVFLRIEPPVVDVWVIETYHSPSPTKVGCLPGCTEISSVLIARWLYMN